jgi:hypothetical protein
MVLNFIAADTDTVTVNGAADSDLFETLISFSLTCDLAIAQKDLEKAISEADSVHRHIYFVHAKSRDAGEDLEELKKRLEAIPLYKLKTFPTGSFNPDVSATVATDSWEVRLGLTLSQCQQIDSKSTSSASDYYRVLAPWTHHCWIAIAAEWLKEARREAVKSWLWTTRMSKVRRAAMPGPRKFKKGKSALAMLMQIKESLKSLSSERSESVSPFSDLVKEIAMSSTWECEDRAAERILAGESIIGGVGLGEARNSERQQIQRDQLENKSFPRSENSPSPDDLLLLDRGFVKYLHERDLDVAHLLARVVVEFSAVGDNAAIQVVQMALEEVERYRQPFWLSKAEKQRHTVNLKEYLNRGLSVLNGEEVSEQEKELDKPIDRSGSPIDLTDYLAPIPATLEQKEQELADFLKKKEERGDEDEDDDESE